MHDEELHLLRNTEREIRLKHHNTESASRLPLDKTIYVIIKLMLKQMTSPPSNNSHTHTIDVHRYGDLKHPNPNESP